MTNKKKRKVNQDHDLGELLDSINQKLSTYIETNHLHKNNQEMELDFVQLRKNLKH